MPASLAAEGTIIKLSQLEIECDEFTVAQLIPDDGDEEDVIYVILASADWPQDIGEGNRVQVVGRPAAAIREDETAGLLCWAKHLWLSSGKPLFENFRGDEGPALPLVASPVSETIN